MKHLPSRLIPAIVLSLSAAAIAPAWLTAQQGPPMPPREARPPQGQPPRDPNAPGAAPVVGKGSIIGIVAVAGSGQPARRARVNLSGGPEGGGSGRSTMTDDMGRFAFTALAEGRYSLSASKAGHINGSFGQRQPGRPGTPIQLADGQRLQLQLQITRGSVITGTVLDENAEAIPGIPVRALRYTMQSGVRTLQSAGSGQTDDRGIYRIYGLQPGDYVVSATPRNVNASNMSIMEGARQVELQQVLQQMQGAERVGQPLLQAFADRAGQLRTTSVAGDEAVSGYAPVYYPGTTTAASAGTFAVAAGEEKNGIDFQLQVVPIARVDGIVTSANGPLPPNVQVTLINSGTNVPGVSQMGARVDAQGAFGIQNVPPGQYTLVARATIGAQGREGGPVMGPGGRGFVFGGRGDALAGRGRAGAPGSEPTRLWAATDITVDGRNVPHVVLTLQAGMTVSGRVVFEGATPQPTDLTRLRINLQPVVAPGGSGDMTPPASGRVDAEGRFTIASVVPGRYRLNGGGAGQGWFTGSAVVDGQDALDFPIEVKPNASISSAVITFVDRQSELTGTIVNERSEPVPDYSLIVYPADQRYWTAQSRRIQSTRPATDGRYSFRNLPPGEYRLVPVYDPEPGSWFDPSFLQQLDGAAVRLSIAEGEKKEQNLKVSTGA